MWPTQSGCWRPLAGKLNKRLRNRPKYTATATHKRQSYYIMAALKTQGDDIVVQNPLYSDVLDGWYNKHSLRIKESTAYNYYIAIPLLKKYFAGVYVQEITPEIAHGFVQYVLEKVNVDTSARLYCKVLNMSLCYAVGYGYIYYNPVDEIVLPKRKRAEITPFTVDEVYALMDASGPQWVKDGIMITFRTGMRPGEVYALKWADINLEVGYISVQRAISRASSKTKETKTPSSTRRIDIDSKLIAYLKEMKKEKSSQYVFPAPSKGRQEYRVPWNLSKFLGIMCEEVGIPPRTFYSLRHTHATILFEKGVHPKIVQERLGHSSIKITMDIYSHVAPTIQKQAVDELEKI